MNRVAFKHWWKILTVPFMGGFLVAFIVLSIMKPFQPTTSANESELEGTVLSETVELKPIPSTLTEVKTLGVALLGYGGAGHDGGYLTDALQLLHIDFEKAVIALISIPRDLWVQLPNGRENKINAVITGSAESKQNLLTSGAPALKQVISNVTGLKTDYYIGVDFVGFQRAIGIQLKGLDVEVAETLEDPWYPMQGQELNPCGMTPDEIAEISQKYSGFELEKQFPCRYEHLLYKKGTVHMEGGDALKYVRSRHGSAEGDVSRGRRQQEIIKAIQKKLISLDALQKLPNFFSEMSKHTQTDIHLEILTYLGPALQKVNEFKFKTINLSTSNVLTSGKANTGAFIMQPKSGTFKWEEVHTFIQNELKN